MRCEQRIPDPEIVLTLTAEEARELLCLAKWNATIPQALAAQALSLYQVRNFLDKIERALYKTGVVCNGAELRERF